MKLLVALLMVLAAWPALAQPGRQGPYGRGMQRDFQRPMPQYQRPMPPPERRMGWEERQRLREEVRGGQMSREEARERWRERREFGPGRSPEERQRLRRDIMEANRDLERR